MLCQDIMKREVRYVTAETSVAEAAAVMRDEGIGFLPVCDETRTVVGVLTDRDIAIRVVAENEALDQPVGRFMTPAAVTCRAEEELEAAQDLMGEMQVSRIMCLDDTGQLAGVISLSDVALADADAAITLRNVSLREARA
jgi:CBS domain-containing protein